MINFFHIYLIQNRFQSYSDSKQHQHSSQQTPIYKNVVSRKMCDIKYTVNGYLADSFGCGLNFDMIRNRHTGEFAECKVRVKVGSDGIPESKRTITFSGLVIYKNEMNQLTTRTVFDIILHKNKRKSFYGCYSLTNKFFINVPFACNSVKIYTCVDL